MADDIAITWANLERAAKELNEATDKFNDAIRDIEKWTALDFDMEIWNPEIVRCKSGSSVVPDSYLQVGFKGGAFQVRYQEKGTVTVKPFRDARRDTRIRLMERVARLAKIIQGMKEVMK